MGLVSSGAGGRGSAALVAVNTGGFAAATLAVVASVARGSSATRGISAAGGTSSVGRVRYTASTIPAAIAVLTAEPSAIHFQLSV